MNPKILIISRGVWDDVKGTSSTLTNFFQDYDPNKLAHIYIETIQPNTKCCHRFFQISEFSLVHKLYKWHIKTGYIIDRNNLDIEQVDVRIAAQEAATMSYVRGHRSIFFSMLREVLWGFNMWKSKELEEFILDFNPDVIWLDGSPLPFMYKLYDHVLKIAKKPASIFMQDDVYTYDSSGNNFWAKVRKYTLRRQVKKVVQKCDNMFVASPKMKREYDKIFDVDSIFIAKSIELLKKTSLPITKDHTPIRLVYLGQIIYGRIYSLIAIAKALAKINKDGIKAQLYIYTNNHISDELKKQLLLKDCVFLMPPVPYTEVSNVILENDVLVFVESLESRYCKVARLSFSTKICDYLGSGKCIMAIGPEDVAPIEYFKDEDAALVATNINDIENLIELLSHPEVIVEYTIKAKKCAMKNHDRTKMNNIIYGKLKQLSKT